MRAALPVAVLTGGLAIALLVVLAPWKGKDYDGPSVVGGDRAAETPGDHRSMSNVGPRLEGVTESNDFHAQLAQLEARVKRLEGQWMEVDPGGRQRAGSSAGLTTGALIPVRISLLTLGHDLPEEDSSSEPWGAGRRATHFARVSLPPHVQRVLYVEVDSTVEGRRSWQELPGWTQRTGGLYLPVRIVTETPEGVEDERFTLKASTHIRITSVGG